MGELLFLYVFTKARRYDKCHKYLVWEGWLTFTKKPPQKTIFLVRTKGRLLKRQVWAHKITNSRFHEDETVTKCRWRTDNAEIWMNLRFRKRKINDLCQKPVPIIFEMAKQAKPCNQLNMGTNVSIKKCKCIFTKLLSHFCFSWHVAHCA